MTEPSNSRRTDSLKSTSKVSSLWSPTKSIFSIHSKFQISLHVRVRWNHLGIMLWNAFHRWRTSRGPPSPTSSYPSNWIAHRLCVLSSTPLHPGQLSTALKSIWGIVSASFRRLPTTRFGQGNNKAGFDISGELEYPMFFLDLIT